MRREVTAHATGRAGLGSPGLHLLGLKDHTHTRAGNEVEAQRHNASKHVALFHFSQAFFKFHRFLLYSFNSLAILLAMFLKPIDVPEK